MTAPACYIAESRACLHEEISAMTDDERQRAIDFIVEQQAKHSVQLDKLIESHRRAEHRFDRDERILKLMIRAGARARAEMREHDKQLREQHEHFQKEMREIKDFQAHSDKRLDALIDIVRHRTGE